MSAEQAPNDGATIPGNALTTFATLWSIASVFHIASYDHWDRGMMIVIAVVWLLMKPSSAGRLALLAAAQVFVAAFFSPFISNHWLFTAAVNCTILTAFGYLAVRARTVKVDGAALYRTFAPAARWMLFVLYFYVVFHKLNADFFNVTSSCGTDFYANHMKRFPFLVEAQWASWFVIYFTVIVEAAIPLLMISKKTRHWGVIVGMLFHAIIAFNPKSPFYNFSSMLFAAYTLFLPPDFVDRLSARAQKTCKVGVGIVLAGLGLTIFDPPGFPGPLFVFAPYAMCVIAAVFVALGLRLGEGPLSVSETFRCRPMWLAIFPLALLLNGFMPYLGLKTETSFAMYSNLRTEKDLANHFLIGKQFELFDYQKRYVKLVSSSNETLQLMADKNFSINWFELRRFGSELPDTSVTYIEDGKEVTIERLGDDPELSEPIPLWQYKFFYFRPLDFDEPHQSCHH